MSAEVVIACGLVEFVVWEPKLVGGSEDVADAELKSIVSLDIQLSDQRREEWAGVYGNWKGGMFLFWARLGRLTDTKAGSTGTLLHTAAVRYPAKNFYYPLLPSEGVKGRAKCRSLRSDSSRHDPNESEEEELSWCSK